jgi:hypothetical protein
MDKSRGSRIALPTTFKPVPATDAEFEEARHLDHPQIVGSVMYAATILRPDLAYPAGVLARFDYYPTSHDIQHFLVNWSSSFWSIKPRSLRARRMNIAAGRSALTRQGL